MRALFLSLKPAFRINFKILSRPCQFEGFRKFIRADDFVRLARAPACGNVLDSFGSENDCFAVCADARRYVLIHKTLNMKLPEDKLLSTFVEADHSPLLVGLTFRIVRLRLVDRTALNVEIPAVEYELILAFDFGGTWLTFSCSLPFTDKELQRLPGIGSRGALFRSGRRDHQDSGEQCDAEYFHC